MLPLLIYWAVNVSVMSSGRKNLKRKQTVCRSDKLDREKPGSTEEEQDTRLYINYPLLKCQKLHQWKMCQIEDELLIYAECNGNKRPVKVDWCGNNGAQLEAGLQVLSQVSVRAQSITDETVGCESRSPSELLHPFSFLFPVLFHFNNARGRLCKRTVCPL